MPARASLSLAVILTALLTAPADGQVPVGPPLNAKVSETLMGPRTQRISISEDGDHMGIATPKGSREIVVIDGVEGPVFDEIPANFSWSDSRRNTGSVVFSPTGGHSAYVARRAGDFIAVVDGKEAVTLSTPATMQGVNFGDPGGWAFLFSEDGSHLAYAALGSPASWVYVMDGVKSPGYRAFDLTQSALHGKHLAYVAQTADTKWHAVVDGKVGPGYDKISSLHLTPDGLHCAYVGDRRGQTLRSVVVNDGVEGKVFPGISDLEQAPDGRIAYVGSMLQSDPNSRGGNMGYLVVGTQEAINTITFGVVIRTGYQSTEYHVAFSPDGKRYAYVLNNRPDPGVTVMVNGKAMGSTYDAASQLIWSPDGLRLYYEGRSPTGTFPVMDGKELDGYNRIKEFQWSPDGKRYGFLGTNATGTWMIVDGKVQPKAIGFAEGSLRFSPDSKHVAYGAQADVSNYQPVIDGAVVATTLDNFATRPNPPIPLPQFIYSPDGNHLAYAGRTATITRSAVFVDGVPQHGQIGSYFYPVWSPDSKHFAAVTGSGKGWVIMLDGKLSPSYDDLLEPNLGSSRFIDPHTYRFYAIKGTEIYRVTLDIGG